MFRYTVVPYPEAEKHVTAVICHCPQGTEVGVTVTDRKYTAADLYLTLPARLLPKAKV